MSPGSAPRGTTYRGFVRALARAILAHRAVVLALGAVAVALAVGGLLRLRVDFSALGYFATDDPEVEALLELKRRWGPDDTELLTVVEVSKGTLLEPDRLRGLARVADSLETLPGVEGAFALPDLPDWRRQPGGAVDLSVHRLLEPLVSERTGPALRRELLDESPYVPALLARDGRASIVAVFLDPAQGDDVLEVSRRVRAVRRVLDREQGRHGMRFTLAGIPAVRADAVDLLVRDQLRLVPVVLLVTGLILALFLPIPHGVLVPMATAVVPPVLLFGFLGWVGAPLGLLNQVLFTLIPALAIADSIHLVHQFGEEVREPAGSGPKAAARSESAAREEAIVRTMGAVGWPCFLTSVTTGLGFLSLFATGIPALRELGAQAALGMLIAHAVVIVLVPLLLSVAPLRPSRKVPAAALDPVGRRALSALLRRPARVLVPTVCMVLLLVAWSTRVEVDCRLTDLLPEDHPTAAANRVVDTRLGGTLPLQLELGGATGTFRDPELLERLEELEEWSSTLDGVRTVAGPAGYVAAVERRLSGNFRIPASGAGVVRNLVAARTASSWATDLVSRDLARARVIVRAEDRGGRAVLRLAERIERRFREALPEHVDVSMGGTPFVAYSGTNSLSRDLRKSLVVAYLTVAACIALLWYSWALGALCLVLNSLPLLAAYGLVGALGWRFEPPVAVVLTVGLGIAVDDTIHVLARALGPGGAAVSERAIRGAVATSGPALIATSLVLAFAFVANGTSSFPSVAMFGVLGTVVVVTALVGDLTVLPALVAARGRLALRPKRRGS